ncbi:hypothetical protein J6590_068380 [Homalodisca vitripennis]|nr:hypothetical protein J6590_068380 [Homalodisca vitripennis]
MASSYLIEVTCLDTPTTCSLFTVRVSEKYTVLPHSHPILPAPQHGIIMLRFSAVPRICRVRRPELYSPGIQRKIYIVVKWLFLCHGHIECYMNGEFLKLNVPRKKPGNFRVDLDSDKSF